jgi:hypothetical protein
MQEPLEELRFRNIKKVNNVRGEFPIELRTIVE